MALAWSLSQAAGAAFAAADLLFQPITIKYTPPCLGGQGEKGNPTGVLGTAPGGESSAEERDPREPLRAAPRARERGGKI
eukprot:2555144-Rhodomonas_salina.1